MSHHHARSTRQTRKGRLALPRRQPPEATSGAAEATTLTRTSTTRMLFLAALQAASRPAPPALPPPRATGEAAPEVPSEDDRPTLPWEPPFEVLALAPSGAVPSEPMAPDVERVSELRLPVVDPTLALLRFMALALAALFAITLVGVLCG